MIMKLSFRQKMRKLICDMQANQEPQTDRYKLEIKSLIFGRGIEVNCF